MNRILISFSIFSFILILSTPTSGQVDHLSRYALNVGLGMEKVGVPFRKMLDFPLHSSYHVGLERKWFSDERKKSIQSLDLMVFTNTSAGSGYNIQSTYGLKISIKKTFYFIPSAGVGLVHLFRPKESFILEGGEYKVNKDRGHFLLMPALKLKLGYGINQIGLYGVYQIGTRLGYNDDIPLLPTSFLSFGLRYEI